MEIPTISIEHLADKRQLCLPEGDQERSGKQLSGLIEEPHAVVPDPVAFGMLS